MARKYNLNEQFFSEPANEKSSYWLGYLSADGNILMKHGSGKYKKYNRNRIVLSSKNKDQIEKFKKDINSEHPIKRIKPNSIVISGKERHFKEAWVIDICSKQMASDIIKAGIVPNKSFIARFPIVTEKQKRHCIRGYFDGNGSVWMGKKGICIGFYGAKPILLSIREWLNNSLSLSNSRSRGGYFGKHATIYRLYYGGNITSKNIFDILYSDATVKLDEKYNKYLKLLNNVR